MTESAGSRSEGSSGRRAGERETERVEPGSITAADLGWVRDTLEANSIDPDTLLAGLPWGVGPAWVPVGIELPPDWEDAEPQQAASMVQAVIGDPPLVVLTFHSDGALEVAEYAQRWNGPSEPVPLRRNGSLALLPSGRGPGPIERAQELARLASVAARSRLRRFGTCRSCDELVPPEHMHDRTRCQTCAQRDLGVVY